MSMTKPEKVRTFAHKSRCPVCKGLNTKVRSTGKAKQYRTCIDCGHTYCERGFLI